MELLSHDSLEWHSSDLCGIMKSWSVCVARTNYRVDLMVPGLLCVHCSVARGKVKQVQKAILRDLWLLNPMKETAILKLINLLGNNSIWVPISPVWFSPLCVALCTQNLRMCTVIMNNKQTRQVSSRGSASWCRSTFFLPRLEIAVKSM